MAIRQPERVGILATAVIVVGALVTLMAAFQLFWSVQYVVWVATRGEVIDAWTVLTVIEIALAVGGVAGVWLCLRRGRARLALAFLPLPFVGSFLVEANRCDVMPMCAWAQWATLPRAAFEWRVPLREPSPGADLGRRGSDRARHNNRIEVLDGDTLLFNGRVVRIAGIDAPELGQTAKCWAEAALGGESRQALEGEVSGPRRPDWVLSEVSKPDAQGRIRANLVAEGGHDLRDSMVVNGFAARTDGRWDWCGRDPSLHSPRYDEKPPHGPNMWWPADHIYDARSAD